LPDLVIDQIIYRRLPVASGLNIAWVAPQRPQKSKKGIVDSNVEVMDDQVALSTRPDFLASPDAFDRRAAAAQLLKANQCNSLQINKVSRIFMLLSHQLIIPIACCPCVQSEQCY
jgi:hypothetical protein